MKKLLLLPVMAGISFASTAQVNVSTAPSNKVAVLEEYTGNFCTYCPDGHKIAAQLDANYGTDIITLKIQTGSFSATDPVFGGSLQTPTGNTIAGPFDSQGYPNGSVNRTNNYSGIGRGDWAGAVADIVSQPSPVNLYVESSVDVSARTLDVSVEYYYTDDAADATNYLHIGYYQDNIPAFQYDPGFYPENFYILSEEVYEFDHAFRDMVNGNFGEQISTTTTGSTDIVTHSINLPAGWNDFDLEAGAVKVFAFVSTSAQGDILTAAKATPTFSNYPTANDVSIVYSKAGAEEDCVGSNGSSDPIILVANNGENDLASFDTDYGVNGGTTNEAWTGNLAHSEKIAVELATANFTYAASNTLDVDLTNPNGSTDDDQSNNSYSVSFAGGVSENSDKIRIDVATDQYANDESEFNVYDGSGALLFASGMLPNSTTTSYEITIPTGTDCYKIELLDDYGDGWGVGANASLKVYDITQGANSLLKTVDANNFADVYNAAIELTSGGSHASLIEEELLNSLSVYPNPTNSDLTIDFSLKSQSNATINLINGLGQVVKSTDLGSVVGEQSNKMNVSNLEAGMYVVKVKTDNGVVTRRVSIIQ